MAREELHPGWLLQDPAEESDVVADAEAFSEEDGPQLFIASVGDLPDEEDPFECAIASF
ncbi:hypothetical protein [Corallococcus llansteffanensis]|uniref:hypothetical protein n=1 Tax=Corallococcus llansteffanensis TaxID=2316731 RepID=UPI0013158A12|nr:hypothetical protein [Corallococcus llansteffanensis]